MLDGPRRLLDGPRRLLDGTRRLLDGTRRLLGSRGDGGGGEGGGEGVGGVGGGGEGGGERRGTHVPADARARDEHITGVLHARRRTSDGRRTRAHATSGGLADGGPGGGQER